MVLVSAVVLVPAAAAAASAPRTTLHAGQRLIGGQSLVSSRGFVRLVLQGGGNLIIYAGGSVLWTSGTNGHPHSQAVLQRGGDFVLYSAQGRALWHTKTNGAGSRALLRVGDNGRLALANSAGRTVWYTKRTATTLATGGWLRGGQALTGRTGERLVMLYGGNLALYRGSTVRWQSRTGGRNGASAAIRADGKLVILDSRHRTVWTSPGAGAGRGARLVLQPGGNLTLVASSGRVAWQTNTGPVATSAQLATRLLSTWGGTFGGAAGVRADLLAVRAGKAIRNSSSCGNAVRIDIRVLRTLVSLTARYRVGINNIVTGHSCDTHLHPKGRAVDVGTVVDPKTGRHTNFDSWRAGDNPGLDRQFASTLGTLLPTGGGLGQVGCAGGPVGVPSRLRAFADACNHQHFDVGSR